MQAHGSKRRRILAAIALAVLIAGCKNQKQTDTGKTYTSSAPAAPPGGGVAGSGGASDAKPLDAPADTTNGKSSRDSDAGSSQATHKQVVAEPGAPVENSQQANPPKTMPPSGH